MQTTLLTSRIFIFALVNFLIFFTSSNIYAQNNCCTADAEFSAFANEEAFIAKHESPRPFVYKGKGEMISFPASDGKTANAFLIKNNKKTNKYIFVIHEWWGLNEHIKREAEKIFNEVGNVNVIALDLYDGKVASAPEEASKLMQAVVRERAEAIILGAIAYAGKGAKIGTLGWCFGGAWSLQAAILAGKQAKACVIYYGMPEKNVEKLKTLKTDVLGIFAAKEKWISPEIVREFEENMKKAGKSLIVHNFDAEHAFANPSSPRYEENAAKEANQLTLEYFKKKL